MAEIPNSAIFVLTPEQSEKLEELFAHVSKRAAERNRGLLFAQIKRLDSGDVVRVGFIEGNYAEAMVSVVNGAVKAGMASKP